jgi:hypothetical protein
MFLFHFFAMQFHPEHLLKQLGSNFIQELIFQLLTVHFNNFLSQLFFIIFALDCIEKNAFIKLQTLQLHLSGTQFLYPTPIHHTTSN